MEIVLYTLRKMAYRKLEETACKVNTLWKTAGKNMCPLEEIDTDISSKYRLFTKSS